MTFAVVAWFVRATPTARDAPHIDLRRFAIVRALSNRACVASLRAFAVAVFAIAIVAGFIGDQTPYRNPIVPIVWVIWWVGFAFVCALIGDAWALVNPLDTTFRLLDAIYGKLASDRSLSRYARYPPQLGAWPAVVLFAGFAWCELIWRDKDVPMQLACVVMAYALVAWVGMLVFDRRTWLQNAEAFSVAFGVLARFAPLCADSDAPSRAIVLRPPGAGLVTREPVHVSMVVFVLLMLATVTFDGFQETAAMQRLETAVHETPIAARFLFVVSEWGVDETQLIHTLTLVAFPIAFVALFMLACRVAAGLAADKTRAAVRASTTAVARAFVLTLVPIAVAYHLSHYLSLLFTASPFVVPLVSDPFARGWDLFGTAHQRVDIVPLHPYVVWYSAVALIVVGHVIAVFLAHIEALRLFGERRAALSSQVPITALMVAYTTLSLWIFAQPIVG